MGTSKELRALPVSLNGSDAMEIDLDMNDDELLFDDLDGDDLDLEPVEPQPAVQPAWRRLEMLRESQWLESEMADFDDYDTFAFGDGNARPGYHP